MLCILFNVGKPGLADLGPLTSMVYRYLEQNQFSGPLPSSIGNLTNLQYL